MTILALDKSDLLPFIAPWLVTFLVGIGMIVNGLLFTLTRKELPGNTYDAISQRALDSVMNRINYEAPARNLTNELAPATQPKASITDHTTHHLRTGK